MSKRDRDQGGNYIDPFVFLPRDTGVSRQYRGPSLMDAFDDEAEPVSAIVKPNPRRTAKVDLGVDLPTPTDTPTGPIDSATQAEPRTKLISTKVAAGTHAALVAMAGKRGVRLSTLVASILREACGAAREAGER